MAKRQQRQRHEFHVLYCNGKADDGQRKDQRETQVHDGKFQPRQDDPDDIHDQCNRTAWRFSLLNLSTKRCEDPSGEPETHQTERNAYDRQAQQNATENVTQEDHESTEYEEDNVAEQRHGDYFTNVLREKRQSCPIAEIDKTLCVNIAWRRRESS